MHVVRSALRCRTRRPVAVTGVVALAALELPFLQLPAAVAAAHRR